jgi:hypothetical protein
MGQRLCCLSNKNKFEQPEFPEVVKELPLLPQIELLSSFRIDDGMIKNISISERKYRGPCGINLTEKRRLLLTTDNFLQIFSLAENSAETHSLLRESRIIFSKSESIKTEYAKQCVTLDTIISPPSHCTFLFSSFLEDVNSDYIIAFLQKYTSPKPSRKAQRGNKLHIQAAYEIGIIYMH